MQELTPPALPLPPPLIQVIMEYRESGMLISWSSGSYSALQGQKLMFVLNLPWCLKLMSLYWCAQDSDQWIQVHLACHSTWSKNEAIPLFPLKSWNVLLLPYMLVFDNSMQQGIHLPHPPQPQLPTQAKVSALLTFLTKPWSLLSWAVHVRKYYKFLPVFSKSIAYSCFTEHHIENARVRIHQNVECFPWPPIMMLSKAF